MLISSLASSFSYHSPAQTLSAQSLPGQQTASLKSEPLKPIDPLRELEKPTLPKRDADTVSLIKAGIADGSANTEPNSSNKREESAASLRQEEAQEQRALEQMQREIRALASRDREVRAHEQAHMAVGGQYAGAAQYQYQRGPDGIQYAVGGEVPIDVGREATPEATIAKMQVVKRAALAPAEPSSQDRRVAAQAARTEAQARQELTVESAEEATEAKEAEEGTATTQQSAQSENRDTQTTTEASASDPVSQGVFPAASISSRLALSIANTKPENTLSSLGINQFA